MKIELIIKDVLEKDMEKNGRQFPRSRTIFLSYQFYQAKGSVKNAMVV
ncbi:MAG: hypothetical protein LBO67_07640 [Spirochaetaceae bacterium]|jgi:hypothetical protein|nr:hypothetical protein [Spirochaetaceae bacterium]